MQTIVLFDVDGTLLAADGAGRAAMECAMRRVTGVADTLRTLAFAGLTDRLIVRTGLRAAGHRDDDATIDIVLEHYLDLLQVELDRAPGFRVLGGVRVLVESLLERPDVAVGLGTGNVEAGARLKLRRAGLDHLFAFGGFGCDHEERSQLLLAGALRGRAVIGSRVSPEDAAQPRVVVVGDTPLDVRAAHAIGARAVAVTTGPHTAEELAAAGADVVLRDLGDGAAEEQILGASRSILAT